MEMSVILTDNILPEVKQVILSSTGSNLSPDALTPDYFLVGNLLDSMAVTNLILGLEEYFGFSFIDEELSVEAFETVASLTELVKRKLEG